MNINLGIFTICPCPPISLPARGKISWNYFSSNVKLKQRPGYAIQYVEVRGGDSPNMSY